jgi:hypothetical protein
MRKSRKVMINHGALELWGSDLEANPNLTGNHHETWDFPAKTFPACYKHIDHSH